MTEQRHTADTITDDALDALYARAARAERAVRRAEGSEGWMAKHLARQDSRVHGLTCDRDRWRRRAEQAEELLRVAEQTSNRSETERARAVQRAERAEAAIERVRALHQPMRRGPFTICMRCSGWDGEWRCLGVVTDYPCDTLAALDKPQEQRP